MFVFFAPALVAVWFFYVSIYIIENRVFKILTLIVLIIALLCYIDIILVVINKLVFKQIFKMEWYLPFYS